MAWIILIVLNIVFGFVFLAKNLTLLRINCVLDEQIATKTRYFYYFSVILLVLFVKNKSIMLFLIHFPVFLLLIYGKFVLFYRNKQFRKYFYIFLDQILTKMRLGHCFRDAIDTKDSFLPFFVKEKIQRIQEVIVFSGQTPVRFNRGLSQRLLREILDVFLFIDQNSHLSIKYLELFKDQLKAEGDFRQKISQIMYQIWIQSLILLCFYIGLLIYVIYQHSFYENIRLIGLSSVLFFAGLSVLIYLGRSFKWKL